MTKALKSLKTALAATAVLALTAGNAVAQDNAKIDNRAMLEQIYLVMDANHNRVEEVILAKAEQAVSLKAAKIENNFAPAGGWAGLRIAALQSYNDCIL